MDSSVLAWEAEVRVRKVRTELTDTSVLLEFGHEKNHLTWFKQ